MFQEPHSPSGQLAHKPRRSTAAGGDAGSAPTPGPLHLGATRGGPRGAVAATARGHGEGTQERCGAEPDPQRQGGAGTVRVVGSAQLFLLHKNPDLT